MIREDTKRISLVPTVIKSELIQLPSFFNTSKSRDILPVPKRSNTSEKKVSGKKYCFLNCEPKSAPKKYFILKSKSFENDSRNNSCTNQHRKKLHLPMPVKSSWKHCKSCRYGMQGNISTPICFVCVSKARNLEPEHLMLPTSVTDSPLLLKSRAKSTIVCRNFLKHSESNRKDLNYSRCTCTNALKNSLNASCLSDRLTLIHCYGDDYERIAMQRRVNQERQVALAKQQVKITEKIGREKRKQDQRKKIFALNRLMTDLERKKFKAFMNDFKAADL